jgi:hypothetical protein
MSVVSEGVQAIADGSTVRMKAMPASDSEKPVATSGKPR